MIHAGDTYFSGMYPFIDVSSGGSIDGLILAVDRLLEISDGDSRIIPGHGSLSNRTELEDYRTMLVKVRDRITDAVSRGQTVEEVVASRPTADLDPSWEKGLSAERFVRIVYADLSRR